ncbi:DNA/RNA non-specific endonuclease [Emcibacter sp.]|uniref:DNA/RNA non-specific endonuclease n=1 Tax=Emcibacter sp. TaxID=1979954 RepID=UPI002AA872D4|nr:DNA/RNA non-specific endonuclease [Emcibacter sp.]
MKKIIAVILLLIGSTTWAEELHIVHCLYGCPSGTPETNDLIIREIYALSSNDDTKFADWVAYRVTKETIGTTASLNRDWKADPLLDDNETLEPGDYKRANRELDTDRGHQVPLASFAGTIFWRSTNFLSNITPQKSDLNQGAWVDLEEAVRHAAYHLGEVYVVTGPLYEHPTEGLPEANEEHKVPSGYWKVVATKGGATAFLFDQGTPRDDDYCGHVVLLTEIEQRNGLILFPTAAQGWPSDNLSTWLGC